MKKIATILVALGVVVGGIVAPTAATAAEITAPGAPVTDQLRSVPQRTPSGRVAASSGASPTGQYEWVCVLTTGNTYSMRDGEPLTNCKGSFLQKYLNGRQLAIYRLAYDGNGAIANVKAEGCLLAVAGGVLTVLSPAWTLRYVAAIAVGGMGVYVSCKA